MAIKCLECKKGPCVDDQIGQKCGAFSKPKERRAHMDYETPRNYRVQTYPDGCHNCGNRYSGMVSDPGNIPILTCKLQRSKKVDPLGKCDAYFFGPEEQTTPPVSGARTTGRTIRLRRPS